MPPATVYSPGLVFSILILQLASANAAKPFVGVPDEDSEGCDDGDGCTAFHPTKHRTRSDIPTWSRSSDNPIPSDNRALPASSSSTVTANAPHRTNFSTAAIVGATLASFIILGLLLMLLVKYLDRARKARQRPAGSVPVFPNLSSPGQTNAPDNEMSQSQSRPLTSSAGVARAIIDPTPPYSPFYEEDRRTNPPLSPLATPAVPLRHSAIVDASSPSNEHTNYDASSSHEPLQSIYATSSSNNASLPLLAVGGHGAGFFSSSSSPEPSGPHRVLEAGEKRRNAQITRQTSQLEMRDPPPDYYS